MFLPQKISDKQWDISFHSLHSFSSWSVSTQFRFNSESADSETARKAECCALLIRRVYFTVTVQCLAVFLTR